MTDTPGLTNQWGPMHMCAYDDGATRAPCRARATDDASYCPQHEAERAAALNAGRPWNRGGTAGRAGSARPMNDQSGLHRLVQRNLLRIDADKLDEARRILASRYPTNIEAAEVASDLWAFANTLRGEADDR